MEKTGRLGAAWLAAVLFTLGAIKAGASAASPPTPQLTPVNVQSLLQGRTVAMGSINSFELTATLETLEGGSGLSYLDGKAVNGLVVSMFADRDASLVKPGMLYRTVLARVGAVAPDVRKKFDDLEDQFIAAKNGDVIGFDLNLPPKARKRFPIDRVIVVVLGKGQSTWSVEYLNSAFASVISDAKTAHLDALVVPCIGYRWEDKNSLTFADLFRQFFLVLDRSSGPLRVSFSLYSGWPSFVVENAVATLNLEASKVSLETHPR